MTPDVLGTVQPAIGLPVHLAFDDMAERFPGRVAIRSRGGEISYHVLRAMTDAGAELLAARRVGPGDRVAVMMDRTPAALAALLAVLKTGAAYVPIDPALPVRRLESILTATTPAAMIGTRRTASAAIASIDAVEFASAVSCAAGADARLRVAGEVAYVVTTSGTTGVPKPIVTTHANLTWSLTALAQHLGLCDADVFLARTSLTFDPHTVELLLPLSLGASIAWATPEESRNPSAVAALIDTYGVTVAQGTPSFWQLMAATRWVPLNPLKLLCGGEALSPALQRKLLSAPGVSVWNVYGPTETTVWAGALEMTADEPPRIGGQLRGSSWAVRNAAEASVAIGEVGELWIGSPGVSPGYLGRPELTDRAFRAVDGGLEGLRSYRTGDMVRRRDDDTFDYVGRVDRQRKVRGHRVELSEIEVALASCAEVDAVAVVVAPAGTLRAVIATKEQSLLGLYARLRIAAQAQLPENLVPAEYAFVSTLPLGPTEKLDEGALLNLTLFCPDDRPSLDMSDRMVRSVADTLADVLGGRSIDQDVLLADVGVDSLNLVQLQLRLSEAFGQALDLATLRMASSVSGIVDAYRALDRKDKRPGGPARRDRVTLPLTPAQRRVLIGAAGQVREDNILQLLVSTDASVETVTSAAHRLLATVDVFCLNAIDLASGMPSQTFSAEPTIGVEQWPARDTAAVVEALRCARDQLNVGQGRFCRCVVGTLDGRTFLYLAMHHVIADGVSLEVVKALLGSFLATPAAALAATPFATWARIARERNVVDATIAAHWRDLLRLETRTGATSDEVVARQRARPQGADPIAWTIHKAVAGLSMPSASRAAHDLVLAASVHQYGVQRGVREVGCRVVESGRGLYDDLDDGLTVGMLSHHHPIVVPTGSTPRDTLVALQNELARAADRGSSYEWLRADPTWGRGLPALSEMQLYVNYLPDLPAARLVDETWRLADGGEQRQVIPGIALVIRPAADGLHVTSHYNDVAWQASAVEEFLDGFAVSAAELADMALPLGVLVTEPTGQRRKVVAHGHS
ncbi:amino acid adenylation domain-containing protein [Dactylosporangium sp. NPDC051485]|uniref:amino acid adenylation domain-containing protein n=1 Tax=Dactylosporangium sp. NPDC051485 TaxID=3154846 RepID=UPI00344A1255